MYGQLPRNPALADTGHAGDRHEARPLVTSGGEDDVAQQSELVIATDEGRLDLVAPAAAAALGHDPDRTECRHRGDLALEHLVSSRLEGDGRIRGLLRLLTDEDRARRGHALEARCGVHDVARDKTLVGGTDGDRSFSGQHSGSCLDPGTERPDAVDQVQRGADGSFGVVVMRDRRAPDGHHGVADELLDRPAIAADDLLALLEIARQEFADGFGVTALGERREPDEIGEQDRHQATLRNGRWASGDARVGARRARGRDWSRSPAHAAEPGALDQRRPASGASRSHRRSAARTEPRVGWGCLAAFGAGHPRQSTESARQACPVA